MSIGPILPGRLPPSLLASRLQQHIANNTRDLTRLQEQISSGQQFFLPSESPVQAVRTIVLQKTLERQEQLKSNLGTDRSLLSVSETALAGVGDALNQAKSFAIAGTGDSISSSEKEALAVEVGSLMQSVLNTANTEFRGRQLFGGSQSQEVPFEMLDNGFVRYNGDEQSIDSFIALDQLLTNNIDGNSGFNALTKPVGNDINPALTLNTKAAGLLGGLGVELGEITVTLDNGGPAQTQTVDLSSADTIGDIKTILENAFAAGPLTLTVDVDPATSNGIRLTSSAGTVAVSDLSGSMVAADLGIASAAVAQINGGNLDPSLTIQTQLADLNGGAGIGPVAGNGLLITNGPKSQVVDISSATTVEDLFNLLKLADLNLQVGINQAGNGLAISSRLSGADFSIGENNGTNAANLGIRTFDGGTLLADLNLGLGVPVDDGFDLDITRRDGSSVSIDLSNTATVQQVLDAINTVDPGNLVASLNAVGNGISLLDNSGAGSLTVDNNALSDALGLNGEETTGNPATPLIGRDVNSRRAEGVFSILQSLETALRSGDNVELARLSTSIDVEAGRFNQLRGEIGSRLKLIDNFENRLLDEEVEIRQSLSEEFDTNVTDALTEFVHTQQALEATLKIASQTLQLNLLSFL